MPKRDWTAARVKCDEEARCRFCKRYGQLDAAHIIPRSLGGGQSADAIVPLCRKCHDLYDDFALDLLGYLTRDEEVQAVRTAGLYAAITRISPDFNPRRQAA